MKIGIIGSGNIGATLARLLVKLGHEVVIANSRGPESLSELISELGAGAKAATAEDAAKQGEIVIEAIPFGKLDTLPKDALAGKVLISAANLYPGRDGDIDLGGVTQTEYLQKLLPDTKIAKAFNTIYFEHLAHEGDPSKPMAERRVIPFAARDSEAETAARSIIEELGFGALFLGDFPKVRGISEPGDRLYNKQLSLSEAQSMLET